MQIAATSDRRARRRLGEPSLPKLITFESVHSMDGKYPDRQICDLAEKYNVLTYLEEVHAAATYGRRGGSDRNATARRIG